MCPSLNYACTVWNPHTASDKAMLETVQRHAARWVCGSRWSPSTNRWSKSSDVCLQELQWPTLASHRNYLSVSMMYDIMHDQYSSLKLVNYCTFNSSCTRAMSCSTTIYNKLFQTLFFVNTVFLWNTVLVSVLMISPPKFRPAMYLLFCHS